MTTTQSTKEKRERAVLVTVEMRGHESWPIEDRALELKRLTESCGVDIVETEICRRKAPNAGLFIGKGKVQELVEIIEETGADVVIFNNDLSPSQQKNLEEILTIRVIDRTQLILDIFARRATSNEGKVQVELAQLVYLLPRLSRMWEHLSRQYAGVGMKGPGEKQLEIDRRRISHRITSLKRELKEITNHRNLQRTQREKFSMLTIALIGYTNSGKSTLFNAFTDSSVKVKDQLFSTLDPTVRKMLLPNNQVVLLSDTVGFLHELPHHLVESFKATLEEVVNADILFHIIDMSGHLASEQNAAVQEVLNDLGVQDKPVFTVLNKADKVPGDLERYSIKRPFPEAVVISALKGEGLAELKDLIVDFVQKDMEDIEIILPHKHYKVAKEIREKGNVEKEEYGDEGLFIKAMVPTKVKYAILKKLRSNVGTKKRQSPRNK
ncbi:MAG: GTPase HflX [Candidatus Omnitrophica bacterium]|nr:GTPase HflX [Candidatus Omnitrophota bacterium]